jgi:hypothetical protein
MLVESIGTPVASSTLQPGQCFFFQRDSKSTFAILSVDEGTRAAVVFSEEVGERTPWIILGALPSNVLLVDGAIIRPEWSSLTFQQATLPLGAITNASGRFYVSAALHRHQIVTIDVQTGMLGEPPQRGPTVYFPIWSAGIFDRDKWVPLFKFPITPASFERSEINDSPAHF